LAREYTDLSLVQIGMAIGGRQHNTIISGLKRIQEQIASDSELAEQVTCARQYLMS
jgi:chromosomal replication initiator protein